MATRHIIDAKGKPLGRLATKIALLLQDKDTPAYEPRLEGKNVVVVKNAHLAKVSGSKAADKVYYRHSGKPGGLKVESYSSLMVRKPEQVLINAVRGMLPNNKLRDRRLKRLIIEKETNNG